MKRFISLFFLIILLLSACSTTNKEPEIIDIKLTYTGRSCDYEGPDEVQAGPITLTFYNEGDSIAAMVLMRHLGDESIQDMKDHWGEGPFSGHQPDWAEGLVPWKTIMSGNTLIYDLIVEPGIHTMVCGQAAPWEGWFNSGFIVSE